MQQSRLRGRRSELGAVPVALVVIIVVAVLAVGAYLATQGKKGDAPPEKAMASAPAAKAPAKAAAGDAPADAAPKLAAVDTAAPAPVKATPAPVKAAPAAILAQVEGSVESARAEAGPWAAVSMGAGVSEGDFIRTGKDGRAELVFHDSRVRLGPETQIALSTLVTHAGVAAPKFSMRLLFGRAWSAVSRAFRCSDCSFRIETKNAVAGVRGTTFRIDAERSGAALVRVYAGSVAVADPTALAMAPAGATGRQQVAKPQQVSKGQWEQIVATAMMEVRISADGKSAKSAKFAAGSEASDAWVKWNQKLDGNLPKAIHDAAPAVPKPPKPAKQCVPSGGGFKVTGVGTPMAGMVGEGQGRASAERAAWLGALGEAAKCLKKSGAQPAGWKVSNTRYYNDKSVEIDLEVSTGDAGSSSFEVVGTGAANLEGGRPVSQVRIEAIRVAETVARAGAAEVLQKILPEASAGAVRQKFEGQVEGCKTAETLYFEDGAVSVRLRCGAGAKGGAKPRPGPATIKR